MRQMTRFVYLVVLLLMVSATAAGSAQQARTLVIQVTNQVVEALGKGTDQPQHNPDRLYELLDRTVAPHFDFDSIARLELGHYWRSATPQQRQRFTAELRRHLLKFYSGSLAKYRDQNIKFKPVASVDTDDAVVVRTEVQQPGVAPIRIDYRLHLVQGKWKVIDVVVDGVSMVVSNRSSFTAVLRNGGIDALTTRLATHNRENGI